MPQLLIFFLTMSLWSVLGAASGIVSLGQQGYNLYKDITNTDNKRAVEASLELMQQQQQYNVENQERAQEFNVYNQNSAQDFARSMYGRAQDDYVSNMHLQHELNQESMAKQFGYNAILSNAGRSIMQQRLAGVNPSGSSAGGSVTALGASGGAPSPSSPVMPSSSTPSVPSATLPNYSHYAVSTETAGSFLQHLRSSELTEEQANNMRIKNITQLTRDLSDIELMRSEYVRNMSQSRNFDANTDKTLKTLDASIEFLRGQINELEARSKYYDKVGSAAEKNAETASNAQEESVRHNKAMESIQRVQNSIAQQGVNIEAAKLESVISKMAAEIDLLDDAHRKNMAQEPNWIREQLAKVGLDEALMEKAKNEAELRGLDVDTYYLRMGHQVLDAIYRELAVDEQYEDKIKYNKDGTVDNGKSERKHTYSRKRLPKTFRVR